MLPLSYGEDRQSCSEGGRGLDPFHTIDSSNFGARSHLPNLAAYAAGQPELFTKNRGNTQVSFAQNEYFSFFQDEVQVRTSLSVSLGLRYEWQSNIPTTTILHRVLLLRTHLTEVKRSCAEDSASSTTANQNS